VTDDFDNTSKFNRSICKNLLTPSNNSRSMYEKCQNQKDSLCFKLTTWVFLHLFSMDISAS